MIDEIEMVVKDTMITENQRLKTLPKYLGQNFLVAEAIVYNLMEYLSVDYNGGYWNFYELDNGGFFMSPEYKTLNISVDSNYFKGELSGKATGIVVSLFAFSNISFEDDTDRFAELYYKLKEYAYSHAEASKIFAAID